jgi:hypothetical protein
VIPHDSYLAEDAQALSRRAVSACGDASLVLGIAGMDIELAGLSAQQLVRAQREYAPVIVDRPRTPPCQLMVMEANTSWFRPIDLSGGEYRLALSHDAGGAWLSGLQFLARLAREPRPSMTLWVDGGSLDAFEGALINSLRVLVAYGLLDRGGLLLHSAAIESAGRAYVFFGPSGAGKSTLCHISAQTGRTVISDELNALVPAGDGFEVLALPFAGDFGRTAIPSAAIELGGLFRLRQAPAHELVELPRATAIASLFAACPYVNVDPVANDRVLALAQRLQPLRMLELRFSLDAAFWSLVETAGHQG